MNLNHLRVFHAVAQENSVTRGAAKLFISQPAASKQIKELERALGVPLVDRTPKGIRLTDAGQHLVEHSRRLFAIENDAERTMQELKGVSRGRLAVAASTTMGIYLMPEVLAVFRARHPLVDVRLDIANDTEVQKQVLTGRSDVAFTGGPIEHPDLEAASILNDELVALASPKHPLAKQKQISAADLLRFPCILREAGSGMRVIIERSFATRGLSFPQESLSLTSTEAIKRAVCAGLGVAILSRLTVQVELKNKTLARLEVDGFPIVRPMHVLRLRGRHESHALRAFMPISLEALRRANLTVQT